VTARLLRALNSVRVWVNRLWWQHRAMAAYDAAAPIGSASPLARFRLNENLPMRGHLFRVVRLVDGPEPVMMLQPIAPTRARVKLAGAVGKRRRRILEQQAAQALRQVSQAQAADRRRTRSPGSKPSSTP